MRTEICLGPKIHLKYCHQFKITLEEENDIIYYAASCGFVMKFKMLLFSFFNLVNFQTL